MTGGDEECGWKQSRWAFVEATCGVKTQKVRRSWNSKEEPREESPGEDGQPSAKALEAGRRPEVPPGLLAFSEARRDIVETGRWKRRDRLPVRGNVMVAWIRVTLKRCFFLGTRHSLSVPPLPGPASPRPPHSERVSEELHNLAGGEVLPGPAVVSFPRKLVQI